jgi:hypothetical protein
VTVSGRGSFPLLLMLLLLWSMLNHQCTMVCMRRACAPCAMPMESFPMMLDGVPARCTVLGGTRSRGPERYLAISLDR